MARGGLQGIGHIPYERDGYWMECSEYLGYECLTKSEVFKTLGYKPLPTIEELHRCRMDHRILVGGNRSGKTYGATMDCMPYLFWMNTTGWVVSVTYEMAEELRRKVEDILIERAGMEKVLRPDNLKPYQFSYSTKTHTLHMGTGSTLQLKSADSPNSMHAVPVDYIMIDEAALVPFILYDTRLVPRLADSGGHILSLGTFEWMTGEWFEEYYDMGQVPNDLGIKSWYHPTEDNYHVYNAVGGETPEDIGKEFFINWRKVVAMHPDTEWPLKPGMQLIIWNIDHEWLLEQKKRMRPEIYAARYEAKTSTSPYLVYPDWDAKKNINADRAAFDVNKPVYLAIDPGGTYAVAAVQFKLFDDTGQKNTLTRGFSMCIIDELYFQKTITTQDVYEAASNREWWPNVARWPWPHWDPIQGSIDVMMNEQALTWAHLARNDNQIRGLYLRRRLVRVQAGIQTLQHFISTDSIFAHPRCTFWNVEMRRGTYPVPTISNLETSDPRKGNPKDAWNHLTKGVIYLIVNKFGYYGKSESPAGLRRGDIKKAQDAHRRRQGR